jgi:uracil permease
MARTAVLGVQHLFVMFGATVLVPLLTGLDVAVALFASGAGTLLFHLLTRGEVPIYLGSSFAFIPVVRGIAAMEGGSLAQACGGIAAAGLVYVAAAAFVRLVSVEALLRLFPPHITGTMIVLIGLVLAPNALRSAGAADAPEVIERIGEVGCFAVALLTFAVGALVRVFAPRLGLRFLALVSVLVALASGYLVSLPLGIVDLAGIESAAWFGVPHFTAPEFRWRAVTAALPVAIVTILEHLGDVFAIGSVVGKDFVKRPGLHRTLAGDGLATSLAALIGGPANTTYSENTGAVALTGYFNPAVMRVAAVLAVALAFIPKLAAAIVAVPPPVVGGISVLLFGMIASVGIRTLVEARVDFSRPKVLITTSAMLVLGAGGARLEWPPGGEPWFTIDKLGLAAVVGIVLQLVLRDPPVEGAGTR